ncbi:putative urea transporter [Diplodia seriata]|uniref:Putative urea transporter n=1 Tax=Diplodia seriata TaxID=420778 RepID=A0A0G2HKY5_9PEZI|nr:putative urea transporter [Diplodia seriata]
MGVPSFQASNAIIYLTYGAFLLCGVFVAWKLRHQSKSDYLSSNRTQKGQNNRPMIPLALNFIASALGSGILFTYPEIATIAGVQGLVVYALSSGLPLLIFGYLGPIIRRKCPEGFVLTEWTRQRYGVVAALYLSVMTLITLFLYMVAELSALQQIVNVLTGLDGLPATVVQCVVTTIYTSLGGFKVSFVTDNIQGAMVLGLIIIGVITVGVETNIDRSLIDSSGYLDSNLLGWQLIYILPVAILTNDFFLSGFWLRTFASRSDRDLRIAVTIAAVVVTVVLTLVGCGGLLAAWSGVWPGDPPQEGSIAFFSLLSTLPAWVVGIVLVMVVALSTAAFDSFQSAMVSTGSNDLFRNRLPLWWIRALVVLAMVPVVVVALRSPSVLQVYLISDLVSASLVPVLVVGLVDRAWWWSGAEVVVGGLGGIFSVFLFGCVYYDGDTLAAANLILLENGLYGGDWSAFGAFVAAPVGGLLWAAACWCVRIGALWLRARVKGERFTALDRPLPVAPENASESLGVTAAGAEGYGTVAGGVVVEEEPGKGGKFV